MGPWKVKKNCCRSQQIHSIVWMGLLNVGDTVSERHIPQFNWITYPGSEGADFGLKRYLISKFKKFNRCWTSWRLAIEILLISCSWSIQASCGKMNASVRLQSWCHHLMYYVQKIIIGKDIVQDILSRPARMKRYHVLGIQWRSWGIMSGPYSINFWFVACPLVN